MNVLVSTFQGKSNRDKATNNNYIVFVEKIVPKVSEIFLEYLSSFFSKYSLPQEITTAENNLGLQLYETLAQEFSCEFCEICQNTFLHRTALVDASYHCFNLIAHYFRPFSKID